MTSQKRGARGIPGGTRSREDGRGNGHGLRPTQVQGADPPAHHAGIVPQSGNGHARQVIGEDISVESIMATWLNICDDVRTDLREKEGRRLYDPRLNAYQEWEFNLALDLIHSGFRFWEATPQDMLWNFPEFAREVAKRAVEARLQPDEFMRRAFTPLLKHEEDAGSKALDFLLGKEFLLRKDVHEIFVELKRDHRKKTKPINQEQEDPLELAIGLERSSPA